MGATYRHKHHRVDAKYGNKIYNVVIADGLQLLEELVGILMSWQ